MPTYEYRCPNGHDFERFFRSISTAATEVNCPQCGTVAERRMSAGAGLLFKGSGFYITDYGKDGKKDQRPAAKTDAPAAGAGTGESAGTGAAAPPAAAAGDAKPAAPAKAETKPASAPAKSSGSAE